MQKSLSSRIAERESKAGKSRAAHKTAFLALKADIETALNDGWPIKSIWATLFEENKISFSYQTFSVYVKKYIRKKIDTQKAPSSPAPPKHKPPTEMRTFKFDPTPNIEELV